MFGRTGYALGWVMMVGAAALATGCNPSSAGQDKFDSFSRTRGNLISAQEEIDRTVASLKSLRMTDASNLGNAFKQYRGNVERLETRGAEAKRLAEATRDRAKDHAMSWENDVAKIDDPAVRASAESRREAVKSNQAQLKATAADARAAYDTFLKDNHDIIKALSLDLSPANRTALAPTMDKAEANAKTLKEKVSAVQRSLDNIANGRPPG